MTHPDMEEARRNLLSALDNGWTIEQVSQAIKVSEMTVRKWARGMPKRQPRSEPVIAAFLSLPEAVIPEPFPKVPGEPSPARVSRMGEMKEARRLLLKAHRSNISNYQIRRITGLSIRTIQRWIEKMPEYQGEKTDRVVEGLLLLDFEHYIPSRKRSDKAEGYGADWVRRLCNAIDEMTHLGYGVNQIAYISGIGQDSIRRLMKPEVREARERLTPYAARGVERLEQYLQRRGNDRRRSAREELADVRGSRNMDGPTVV